MTMSKIKVSFKVIRLLPAFQVEFFVLFAAFDKILTDMARRAVPLW